MFPQIDFSKEQSTERGLLILNPVNYRVETVNVIGSNPFNGRKTHLYVSCRIDTGADITILNNQFNSLFEDETTKPVDYTIIQFGGSKSPELPVYKVELTIGGHKFEILAAHAKTMTLISLLGQHSFLNNFDSINISEMRKKFRLIKT